MSPLQYLLFARQYQSEERSLIARIIKTSRYRVNQLIDVMKPDQLSTSEKIMTLKLELAKHYSTPSFEDCNNMGDLMEKNLNLLINNG